MGRSMLVDPLQSLLQCASPRGSSLLLLHHVLRRLGRRYARRQGSARELDMVAAQEEDVGDGLLGRLDGDCWWYCCTVVQ